MPLNTKNTDFLQRNEAIDVLRAFTMLTMIFVNHLWTVQDVPHGLLHAKNGEDFMGLSDVVFPCFLFVVGLSIPYAIERRYSKGLSGRSTIGHIFSRSLALLMMGVFIVNSEAGLSSEMPYGKTVYSLLMVIGFFCLWNQYPETNRKNQRLLYLGLKITGALILLYLAITFRSAGDNSVFSARWWGILGLIGWTYLVCATIYVFTRNRLKYLIPIWIAFVLICLLGTRMNEVSGGSFLLSLPRPNFYNQLLDTLHIGNGTLVAFTMGGVLWSVLNVRYQSVPGLKKALWAGVILAVLLLAGFVSHRYWILSKLSATPPWLFYVLAISIGLYILFYGLVEKGKTSWFTIIKPAGTATLTTYMMPYLAYCLADFFLLLPDYLWRGIPGLANCLCFSLLMVGFTWLLGKMHIKLKV
ncbi:MAG: DUF5009 domain-containing protein [Dysgonamonadaceae bacterium]|jgi:hypothetical protein|nr:DUF5009 domain-containing protein [Dysgonamonadaceae bacterium]